MLPPQPVPKVYTARLRARHHEVDADGFLYPAVYLRYLAETAIDASNAAGFDARWYTATGAGWIIRRSTLEIKGLVAAGDRLEIRTWVEDFRRVRSNRRYEIYDGTGAPCGGAVTDWVFVDMATGKPRRVPTEMALGFGVDPSMPGLERPGWAAPPAPHGVPRSQHRVRYVELDGLGHMNNATYLDVLMQGTLDVFADMRWPFERLVVREAAPRVVRVDIEYLEAALYGDKLEIPTWFALTADGLDVFQNLVRNDGRLLAQATTHWRWIDLTNGSYAPVPAALVADLQSALAA
jgi:YbgC/YbaW family acyl-CoA thioester hydrolase